MFGDVAAGDNWDRMMRVDLRLAQKILGLPYLEVYVNNTSNLCPPLSNGTPNWPQAQKEFEAFLQHYRLLGTPLHKITSPTQRIESHLGWGVDTAKMVVFIKEERRQYLLSTLQGFQTQNLRSSFAMMSRIKFDSLIGIVNFCAQVIRCLTAPLRHFFGKQAKLDALGRRFNG